MGEGLRPGQPEGFERGSSVRWAVLTPQPDQPSSSLEPLGDLLGKEQSVGPGPGPSPAYIRSNTIVRRAVELYCLCIIDSYCILQVINY